MFNIFRRKRVSPTKTTIALSLMLIGLISIMSAGFFSYRISNRFHKRPFDEIRQTDISAIRSWMTLGYISKVYRIPESELEKALNIKPGTFHKSSLLQISKAINKSSDETIEIVSQTILEFQAEKSVPSRF